MIKDLEVSGEDQNGLFRYGEHFGKPWCRNSWKRIYGICQIVPWVPGIMVGPDSSAPSAHSEPEHIQYLEPQVEYCRPSFG
jgi:hypothetical protein